MPQINKIVELISVRRNELTSGSEFLDDATADGVAFNVDHGADGIQRTVDRNKNGNSLDGEPNGLQDHDHGDHAGAGDAGGADGCDHRGKKDHQLLDKIKFNTNEVSNKNSRGRFINGSAVHIDRSPQRYHETGDI